MAVNASDISVAANGDIRWTGGSSTYYTVLELHRYLQDLADNASSSGDDLLDITNSNPSERSTDNIITLNSPYNIDDTLSQHLYDGSVAQSGGDTLYAGLEVIGSVNSASTELQIIQNNAILTSWWSTGINTDSGNYLLRTLIKVRDSGSDIDGKRVRVQAREFGDTYDEFAITMGEGNSVAAINTQEDLNNSTAAGTVGGWSITNTEGYQGIDIDGNGSNEFYYSQWDLGTQSINDLYEFAKHLTSRAYSSTIHGIQGDLFRGITHQWDYDNESGGPFTEDETLSWGSGATAGTALLLALDDNGSTGTMWVQLLTGVVPSDNTAITGGTSSATADVDGSVTQRTVAKPFIGTSTGSALIGAFGIGLDASDTSASDQLTDLAANLVTPPNNVTFTVSGLVSGDRVLVGPDDGAGGLDYDQFSLDTALSAASETSVVVDSTIPSDTPTSGTIRIQTNDGTYNRVAYTSYSGSTFTIGSTDFSTNGAALSNNVFISYIDTATASTSESFTSVYDADRTVFIRVRDGGGTPIKPFETTGTLSSSGGSTTAIRTSDE